MSGDWDDRLFPFVREFLYPRKATAAVAHLLDQGRRFLLIEGGGLRSTPDCRPQWAYLHLSYSCACWSAGARANQARCVWSAQTL
jgi:hypothetical protein